MGSPRLEHAAVRLPDGRVLVAGGSGTGDDAPQRTLTSAELYDPDNGTWSPTGNMLKPQAGFPATLLSDGRVLVGDVDDPAVDTSIIGADSIIGSEVYDPATGTWSSAGTVFTAEDRRDADRGGPWSRLAHGATATLLRDGRVLVAGQGGARVYDPDSGAWSATEKLITPRHDHTATLLGDGTVLVAGGTNGGDRTVYSAELYDPDTGSWTAIANTHRDGCVTAGCPEGGSTATLLHDGTVLFMRFEFAEIYDPATGVWTPARKQPESGSTTKTPLLDGSVLMAGLKASPAVPQPPCAAAALYDPRTGSWTTTSSVLRCGSSFTLLLDGTVLVAGGSDCSDGGVCVATGSAERYVPAGVSPPLASLPEPDPGPDAVPARARTTPGLVTSFSLIRVSTSASTSGRR
jgi:hypothetical protein